MCENIIMDNVRAVIHAKEHCNSITMFFSMTNCLISNNKFTSICIKDLIHIIIMMFCVGVDRGFQQAEACRMCSRAEVGEFARVEWSLDLLLAKLHENRAVRRLLFSQATQLSAPWGRATQLSGNYYTAKYTIIFPCIDTHKLCQ